MSLLELDNIHSYYGHIHALQGISLHVEEGEIVTLIGANGAGKSTTLRTISGLIKPRQGSVRLQRSKYHRPAPASDCRHGRRACARRARDLPAPDRAREPGDGRFYDQRPGRIGAPHGICL